MKSIGPKVVSLKPGDRVGWGYQHGACGRCEACLTGTETYCVERELYALADLDQGSNASQAVWREYYLFKIPDSIPDEFAAPLQCGGATVFTALSMYDIKPTSRVGIVGIGGLGHLAIQFASKMGCDTVVFSSSESKRQEALQLGASQFVATSGAKDLKETVGKPIDALIVTTNQLPAWDLILPVLKRQATIYPLSVSFDDFAIPQMALITEGLRIQGSVVAPRMVHRRMLDFAAQHNIKPVIQTYPMTKAGIDEAMTALDQGKVRYRAVILPEQVIA